MHFKGNDWKRFWFKERFQKCPNGQVIAIFARSPKTRIFGKSAKGEPREIFYKIALKGCPHWKGPRALWRKWHYPLISMHLKCKDWNCFRPKQRLKRCSNCQVMAIFGKSPKTRIFWKKQRGDQEKLLKNRPKSNPRFKGLKALWRKWHYPLIWTHLKCKHWKIFCRKERLQTCSNG